MIITGKKFSKPALSRVINGDTQPAVPDAAPTKVRLDHLLVQQHPEYNRSSVKIYITVFVHSAHFLKPLLCLLVKKTFYIIISVI